MSCVSTISLDENNKVRQGFFFFFFALFVLFGHPAPLSSFFAHMLLFSLPLVAMDDPSMPYHYLGNTGLKVSAICLGTMTFALETGPSSMPCCGKEEAFEMLDTFANSGGNFIDTADMYTDGQAEMIGT
jgi:hypothetical protein